METRYPGLYFFETEGSPSVVAAGVSTAGFVVRTKTGTHLSPIYCGNWEIYQQNFAGLLEDNDYGPLSVKAFFDEGGSGCYVGRVVGANAKYTSTKGGIKSFDDINVDANAFDPDSATQDQGLKDCGGISTPLTTEGVQDLIGLAGIFVGDELNEYKAHTLKGIGKLKTALASADDVTEMEVYDNDTRQFEKGDLVILSANKPDMLAQSPDTPIDLDSDIYYMACVKEVDHTSNKLKIIKQDLAALPADTYVYTATQHLARTKTTADLTLTAAGSNGYMMVENVTNIRKGSMLLVFGSKDVSTEIWFTVIVEKISGNKVYFKTDFGTGVSHYTTGGGNPHSVDLLLSGADVISLEFGLLLTSPDGVTDYEYSNLSIIPSNMKAYFPRILSGPANQSPVAQAIDLESENLLQPAEWLADPASPANYTEYVLHLALPFPITNVELTGGDADDAALGASDYVGAVDSYGNATGLHLFDRLTDINFFAIPALNGQVASLKAANTKCELLKDRQFITSCRSTDLTAQLAKQYHQEILNLPSKYTSVYWPWLKMSDPFNEGQVVDLPPDGHMAGMWSRIRASLGVHRAPANFALNTPIGVTKKVDDSDMAMLNPIGVNSIVWFDGKGIRPFGQMNNHPAQDGKETIGAIATQTFIVSSLKRSLLDYCFRPINQTLFDDITYAVRTFMYEELHKQGAFYPQSAPADAFFVKCDRSTTSDNDVANKRVICKWGFRPAPGAEKIIFIGTIFTNLRQVEIALAA
jgi:phage tail sheath protein FI